MHYCLLLSAHISPSSPTLQILWTFSIYLESVAIMPQLYMISKTGEAESITSHYLFALGLYRALYIANWVWRFYMEDFYDWIAIVAGCVQTALYCDFFYLYITKGRSSAYSVIVVPDVGVRPVLYCVRWPLDHYCVTLLLMFFSTLQL